jgi:hypothetical protein
MDLQKRIAQLENENTILRDVARAYREAMVDAIQYMAVENYRHTVALNRQRDEESQVQLNPKD